MTNRDEMERGLHRGYTLEVARSVREHGEAFAQKPGTVQLLAEQYLAEHEEREEARRRGAARFATPRDELNRVAKLLTDEWERIEWREGPINPSRLANFVDMARVVIADRAQAREKALSDAPVAVRRAQAFIGGGQSAPWHEDTTWMVAQSLLFAHETVAELRADLEKLRSGHSTPPPRGGAVTRTPTLTKPRDGWQAAVDLAADGTALAERFAAGDRKAQHEAEVRLYARIAAHDGGGA